MTQRFSYPGLGGAFPSAFFGRATGGLAPPPEPLLLPGPWLDTFTTPATGGLNGRTTEGGAQSWLQARYTAGAAESFIVASGILTSTNTGSPQQAFGYVTKVPSNGKLWTLRTIDNLQSGGNAANTTVLADHITIGTNVASWMTARFANITGLITSLDLIHHNQANTNTTIVTTSNCQHRAGDTLGVRYRGIGTATVEACSVHNGRRMSAWTVVNQTTTPITNNIGIRAASTARIDMFIAGDPDAERMLAVICQGRVVQRDRVTGAVRPRLTALFTRDVPAVGSLNYAYVDVATRAVISGHNEQPVSDMRVGLTVPEFDADENNASLLLPSLASPPSTAFYAEIRRTDLSSGTSIGRTPYLFPGYVSLWSSQSLATQNYAAVLAGRALIAPAAAPVNCWRGDALTVGQTETTSGNFFRWRQVRSSTETGTSACNQYFAYRQSRNGGLPVAQIQAGLGATLQIERNANSAYKYARNIGIADACYAIGRFVHIGGAYELDLPANGGYANAAEAIADYPNQLGIEVAEIDLLLGYSVEVLTVPVPFVFYKTDADTQAFRRMQAQLCANNPTKYKLGPYNFLCERALTTDQQNVTDKYHLSQSILLPALTGLLGSDPQEQVGYGRLSAAVAHSENFYDGLTTDDRNGPSMVSARFDGDDIIITYNPNGGTLEVRNTGYLGDFRCGHDFGTGPTTAGFTTYYQPTSAVKISATEVRFGFASKPPVGTLVMAAHGTYPYCRTATGKDLHVGGGTSATTNAVYLNPEKRASMICCSYADAEVAPMKPYINVAGALGDDYIVCT